MVLNKKGSKMKKIIVIVLIFVSVGCLIYALPRFKVINEFKTEFGKTENYRNISYDEPYIGSYVELYEAGLSIKLPSGNRDIKFVVLNTDSIIICESDNYKLKITSLYSELDLIFDVGSDNELNIDYEDISAFKPYYLEIKYNDMNFFKPIDKLKFYREKYEIKYRILEELGSKYVISNTNKDYQVIAFINDSDQSKSNFNILSIIVYKEDEDNKLSPYKFIQVEKGNKELFTESEIISVAYSLEILENKDE